MFANRIKIIPFEITYCRNLKELNLVGNQIIELPQFLFEMKSLEILNISGNPIESLPQEIGLLSNLKVLYIEDTKITFLPKELLKLNLDDLECDSHFNKIGINNTGNPFIKKILNITLISIK